MREFLKVLRYIIPYKWYAVLNIFFNIISSLFSLFSFGLAIPFLGILFGTQPMIGHPVPFEITDIHTLEHNFYYWMSDIIASNGKSSALLMIGVLVSGTTLVKTSTWYMANYFMVPIRNNVVRDIRNKLYRKINELHLGYFSEDKKGNIIARMTNDVQEIEFSIMSSLVMIFRNPLKLILYIGTLLIMSPKLTVFALILLPVAGLLIGKIGNSLRKKSLMAQTQMGGLMAAIEETLSGLQIVKAFNAESRMAERFSERNNEYTKIMNRVNRRRGLASPLSEFLGTVAVVAVMWFGGSMVLEGTAAMSSQGLIGYLVIFSQVITPAKGLSNAYYNVQKGMASIDRINSILDAKNKIIEKPVPKDLKSFENEIEYKNVHFAYTEKPVLKEISLHIKKGNTLALVGQSGSGKTTIVDLLPRFYDIQKGGILIDGIDIRDLKVSSLRNLIGYVNQNPVLFNDSFYNNIAFGITAVSEEQVVEAAKIANAHGFIMETEEAYQTNIGDAGGKLSGGQRQRISIARAILKNPPILILDEATSALDTESEKLVQEALEKLMMNRTSIVIAHRLSTVRNADEICVLHEGKIVERGKHQNLLAAGGIYTKLHNMQMT